MPSSRRSNKPPMSGSGESRWQWAAQKEESLPVPVTRRDGLASTPPCPPPERGNFARASSPFRAISRNMKNLVDSCFLRIRPHAGRRSREHRRGLFRPQRELQTFPEGGGGGHSDRDPSEPENFGLRGDRPKQAGQRCGEQAQEAILLHRGPGRARARVSVSARKQMAAGSWASNGEYT